MLYRLINLGKTQRREYLHLNRSKLFQSLPCKSLTKEQRESYEYFQKKALPELFKFYFPSQFKDYNNQIRLEILDFRFEEPKFSEVEAYRKKITWAQKIFLTWSIKWSCEEVQFQIDKTNSLAKNLNDWIEQSFKISKFTLEPKEENQWEVNANKLKVILWISPSEVPNRLVIKFYYEQNKEVAFCSLPKITKQGNFIINGNDRVVVFQSVRAPNAYFFQDNETQIPYGEIIPFKGPWIRVFLDNLNPRSKREIKLGIKFKFLNTGASFDLNQILAEAPLSEKSLLNLFGPEEIIENSLQLGKSEKKNGKPIPKFLFNEKNSYFLLGKLGRQRFNHKMNILDRLKGQTLAEDLKDKEKKIIFPIGTTLGEEEILVVRSLIQEKRLPLTIFEGRRLYSLAVVSPNSPQKKTNILGSAEENDQRTWFDWGDLSIFLSYFINLQHGVVKVEKEEEEKDSLENQVTRRVGDLLYNIFESRFGAFKQRIEKKYLFNISQLKKADPMKLPKIQEFNKAVKVFFHSSTLVQLQNQNNPLAEASHIRKVSRLGLGGSNLTNVSPGTRDVNFSYRGRYCLVETPEGQKIGLVRSLTLNAKIDEYGQVLVPYYLVKEGKITAETFYLTAREELENYITHCSIKINENNEIEDNLVWAQYQRKFVLVPKEKINFIDTSFYHLNSVNSSSIPFFQHNDSVRMLTASNMQKQAVILLKGESPLVASGVESYLLDNASLTIKSDSAGIVKYVDSEKIIIHSSPREESIQQKKNDSLVQEYPIKQFFVTNANGLLTSVPLVKKGEKVEAGQTIACGNYHDQQELALGHNLRVAFMCWKGYNYEDAIVVNERLIKEDILTSLFAKKYIVIRKRLKIDKKPKEEEFYSRPEISHLDAEGIVKLGSIVRENDILVSKRTPYKKQQTEELLLASILGEGAYSFMDSSFRLPWGEKESIVYEINRWKGKEVYQRGNSSYKEDDLEVIEICVVQKRKIEAGDKLTTRFGNKGVVGKIVPEIDMPFDENGQAVDIIFNPLSVPSRMNIGQLIEALLGLVAHKTGIKLLVRPFNTPSWEQIAQITQESGLPDYGLTQLYDGQSGLPFDQKVLVGYIYTIKLNHMVADKFHARSTGPYALVHQQPVKGRTHGGGQRVGEMEAWALEAHGAAYNLLEMMGAKSDDLHLRRLIQYSLIFGERELVIRNNWSESFNIFLQYARALGFDITAKDDKDKDIEFYKQFSKISRT